MSDEEVGRFVRENRFAVLSLADEGHAWGVPLFYGTYEGVVYFQARPGAKTRFLMRTAEACLTVCRAMEAGEWASANVVGRVERVDGLDEAARRALDGVLVPSDWDEGGRPGAGEGEVDTFRLGVSRTSGRYSRPPPEKAGDRDLAWGV
jgi:nitroimidazol reductase NimA-like FMN-containing flavoprotein (pyridoxamine 5'-phosphate oxidase superfamily)